MTNDLVVRSRPGTGSNSEIYPARLDAPTVVYVIEGPQQADGYEWYLIDPLARPCYLECTNEPQSGWIAAADKDGERWLAAAPQEPDCPEPTLEEVSAAYPEERLYCFGARELTLDGVVGTDSTEAPPGWPWKHRIGLYESGYLGPVTGCVDVCNVPWLTVAYGGDRAVPSPLSPVRMTGHFDDARSAACRSPGVEVDQRILTHECRMVFVVTNWDQH